MKTDELASIVPTSELAGVFFSLLLIIGLIFAMAWLVRRFNGGGRFYRANAMKVVTSMPLGSKEKLIVVDVGDKQLLLGVTPHHISYIDEVTLPEHASEPSTFANKLQELLNKHGAKEQDLANPSTSSGQREPRQR